MKTSPKIVLALLALASCAAGAQTVYSGQADQERRERNREEAMANYRANSDTSSTTRERRDGAREEAREAKDKARRGAHKVADSTRRVAHKTASEARRMGHKTAVKARDITARTNAKFGTSPKGTANPEGINPVGTSGLSPTAPSAGTTKQ
jgi:hypothetical protein